MKENLSSFDSHLDEASKSLERKWTVTKQNLKSIVMQEYQRAFPNKNWNRNEAKAHGVMLRIDRGTRSILENFFSVLSDDFRKRKNHIYQESLLRYAWTMDQVTPESTKVRLPVQWTKARESVQVYTGAEATAQWMDRMGAWMGAYHSALQNNLELVAMNNASIQDAAAKVDSTKAGSPAYELGDALDRIIQVELWSEAMEAENDFYTENEENLGLVEVWKTRYGADVCDDCDANEGLTMEEAYGDIPLHPNCRCFWRVVPESFKALLERSDAESRALAYDMDARGLVPDSLVMRDADGGVVGKTIVSFNEWVEGMPQMVGTR
jgi:hypothetical protein